MPVRRGDRSRAGSFAGTAATIGGWRYVQYDGIVATAAGEHFERGRGVNSMMVALLVGGICFLLAGLSALGYGFLINEFSLGNALIIAGTVAASAGMLLIGLWTAVRETTRRLGSGVSADLRAGMTPGPATAGAAARNPAKQN